MPQEPSDDATEAGGELRHGQAGRRTPRALPGFSRYGLATVVVGAVVLVFEAVWLGAGLAGDALVSDLVAIAIAGWASLACLTAARRHRDGPRTFWRLLATTMALAGIGRVLWLAGRLRGTELPHTPVIYALFALGAVTGTAALLSFLGSGRGGLRQTRTVLDGVIVGLSLVPVAWFVVFRDVAEVPGVPLRTAGLFYPLLDLLQLAILVAVAGRARPRWPALTIIGIGIAIRSVADTVYISLVARGVYELGHPIDVCWPLSYLLVAVASYCPPPRPADEFDEHDSPALHWWWVAFPYLPVGGAIVASVLARDAAGRTPSVVLLSGIGLLATLAIRQGLAANENTVLAGRLRRLAYDDQLTGLPNRLSFGRHLRRALRGRQPVAVLLLDLDGFKQVNDRLGHAAGDNLLVRVSQRMRATVGESGMLARVGGDEFAVLLAGDRAARPGDLAGELLVAVADAPDGAGGVHCSASIGIAEYGPHHTGQADLLRDADIAMYAAKAAGKSAYRVCTPPLRAAAVDRAELIAELRRAVAGGEQLELEYQPIVDVPSGRVRSAEALVRWRHPRLGMLPPGRFLPLAEEAGLIVAIDRWVLREACRAAASWQAYAPATTVSVNLASAHLRRADVVATVAEATRVAGLPASTLTLELTETALIDGTEVVLDRLRALRDLGVRIAIDDFGTGYSSLSYLHRIPATDLKIDRSFVSRLGDNSQAYATIDMVNRLASAFDLVVVAEGVETDSQHSVVAAVGCPRGQGYLYGAPRPLADLREVLR